MSAQIIRFPEPVQGPMTFREAIIHDAKREFAERFQRRLSDASAEEIADAIMGAKEAQQ